MEMESMTLRSPLRIICQIQTMEFQMVKYTFGSASKSFLLSNVSIVSSNVVIEEYVFDDLSTPNVVDD